MLRPDGLALAALVLAACGSSSPEVPDADPTVPDAGPREVVSATQTLAASRLVEGMFTGGPDDHAVIHLAASNTELDWNIHGHEDGSTQTVYEELGVMTADYVFVPTSETDWWLLLRNGGVMAIEIDVQIELYGDMQWVWL